MAPKKGWKSPDSKAPNAAIDQVVSAVAGLHISNSATTASTNAATGATPSSTVATSSAVQAVPPTIAPADPQSESLQPVPEVGVRRPPQTGAQPKDRVTTNYYKVTLAKPKGGGTPVLYEYQIAVLLLASPNDLSRSKKKVMIKRFTQLSGFLNINNAPFVVNSEGRIIAWKSLHPNTTTAGLVDQQNVPDFDRNQNGVITRNLGMSLNFVRTLDLNDLLDYAHGNRMMYPASIAEEALNILVGQAVSESNTGAIQIGDNHFFMPRTGRPLMGWGMTALQGYTSHVKARQGGLYLNVNTALSAFYRTGTVHQHITGLAGSDGYPDGFLDPRNPRKRQHLVGVRVQIRYKRDKPGEVGSRKDTPEGRLKSISAFSDKTADQIFFINRLGVKVSVWQHFQTDHPTEAAQSILKGDQICVNTSSTQAGRECWFLPDQLDVIEGQIYRKTLDRLDSALTATMITFSCQPPDVNQKSIEADGLSALGFNPQRPGPTRLVEAGILLNKPMIDVPCRRIPSPAIRYGNEQTAKPTSSGQWSTRSMKFLSQKKGQFQGTTGVTFFCPPGGLARPKYGPAYINGFQRAWQMNNDTPENIKVDSKWQTFPAPSMANLQNVVRSMQASKAGLVVLALPAANAAIRPWYANFRIAMDQVIGKPSLVICEERLRGSVGKGFQDGQPLNGGALIPYFANNAMKICTRGGGEAHSTDGFESLLPKNGCDTLVLGADLIHPKATSSEVCPTIACIAASIDGVFAKFLGSARRQNARVEIIDTNNMISMATEALENWRNNNAGRLPARILYYRDGTGDSQYAGILREVAAIKTAWENAAGPQRSTEVAVTAVVAVKRHTTRFYPRQGGQKTKTGNIMPGSVISSVIVNPYYFEFYLQSHDVQVGSAKATLYRVLENGMNFSEVAMQDITNAFCYNFSHSTTAVSYASPAYYADRLCERSMLYLREFFDNDQSVQNLPNDTVRKTQLDIAWGRGGQGVGRNPWHKNFNDRMFWM